MKDLGLEDWGHPRSCQGTSQAGPAGGAAHRGKGLTANQAGLWRYRVGDHRVICQLQEDRLLVLVVRIGHRSDVYRWCELHRLQGKFDFHFKENLSCAKAAQRFGFNLKKSKSKWISCSHLSWQLIYQNLSNIILIAMWCQQLNWLRTSRPKEKYFFISKSPKQLFI